MPVMRKSQYRWQMTQPVSATSLLKGCNSNVRTSVLVGGCEGDAALYAHSTMVVCGVD